MSSFQPTGQTWGTGTASGPRARFGQRLRADVIDAFVLLAIYVLVYAVLHAAGEAIAFLVSIAYFTVFEGGQRGQTAGKMAVGIRVVSIDDGMPLGYQRALIRSLAPDPVSDPFVSRVPMDAVES
jgi:uncharacterized RDD family membrane protein YckC